MTLHQTTRVRLLALVRQDGSVYEAYPHEYARKHPMSVARLLSHVYQHYPDSNRGLLVVHADIDTQDHWFVVPTHWHYYTLIDVLPAPRFPTRKAALLAAVYNHDAWQSLIP